MHFIFGISIAFFLDLVLISKKRKSLPDIVLSCWLFFIGFHLLLYYLFFASKSYELHFLMGVDLPLPLVHGPFLFLYTVSLTNPRLLKKTSWFLHFIPAIASWIYLSRFYVLSPPEKIFVYQHQGRGHETYMLINICAIIVSGITYISWSSLLLRRHRQRILRQFSYTEKINLRWLQYLTYGLASIWVFVILGNDNLTFGAVVAFILFIGYFGVKQVGIFSPAIGTSHQETPRKDIFHKKTAGGYSLIREDEFMRLSSGNVLTGEALGYETIESASLIIDENSREGATGKQKYAKSGLTAQTAQAVQCELDRLMQEEKLYADSELSLSDLAQRLRIHPNYLSQVINESGQNFYDYVNALRVKAMIDMMANPENQKFTILSMAFECGFNSKSSFNRHFKKITGQSPSAYLQELAATTGVNA